VVHLKPCGSTPVAEHWSRKEKQHPAAEIKQQPNATLSTIAILSPKSMAEWKNE
jgi:hypothetical protein